MQQTPAKVRDEYATLQAERTKQLNEAQQGIKTLMDEAKLAIAKGGDTNEQVNALSNQSSIIDETMNRAKASLADYDNLVVRSSANVSAALSAADDPPEQ